jgi:alpha,alpha-trehalase
MIRDVFWDGLTRHLDAAGMAQMVDPKATSKTLYFYVPRDDERAYAYYQAAARELRKKNVAVEVAKLPKAIDAAFVRRLDGRHGVLTLALDTDRAGKTVGKPFVVPGGRFNEFYGWDSYFIIQGLLIDGRVELAKSMVENWVYEIRHYGRILNANRTYHLTRSQPPFMTSAALAVYDKLPKTPGSKSWLEESMRAAYDEYKNVWMSAPRLNPETGLSRYYDSGVGPCPEVEPGAYNIVFAPYVGKAPFEQTKDPEQLAQALAQAFAANPKFIYPDPKLQAFFLNDRAVRESGHDTTFRFDDRTTDFVSVDLNSLLYKIESDFHYALAQGLLPADGRFGSKEIWETRMRRRQAQMISLMREPETGMMFDYDVANHRRSDYVSATMFYALWAGLVDQETAEKLTKSALPYLLQPGGLSSTARASLEKHGHKPEVRQWDYPYGWAPHQVLAWQGLRRYGLKAAARDLVDRWVGTIVDNYRDYNGTVPEKFNVVTRSHAVFAEYGNVGTQFDYITREGFGWMNASYKIGRQIQAEAK